MLLTFLGPTRAGQCLNLRPHLRSSYNSRRFYKAVLGETNGNDPVLYLSTKGFPTVYGMSSVCRETLPVIICLSPALSFIDAVHVVAINRRREKMYAYTCECWHPCGALVYISVPVYVYINPTYCICPSFLSLLVVVTQIRRHIHSLSLIHI